jgi:hypothetical protein
VDNDSVLQGEIVRAMLKEKGSLSLREIAALCPKADPTWIDINVGRLVAAGRLQRVTGESEGSDRFEAVAETI